MNRYLRIRFVLLFVLIVTVPQLQGCAKNPVTGESELAFMSKQEEIQIGQQHYPIMTQVNNGELQDAELQSYVNRLGNQIAKVSHRSDLPYEFNIVNSSTVNAYALPGGKITVTRGLLLEMDNENELAAVLGHEIAHVTARHAVQQQTRSLITNIFLTAGGLYMQSQGVSHAGLYQDLGSIGASAILASYSRDQERQADRLGIEYMAKAGYNPDGMVELQEILLEKRKREPGAVQQIFSSHPLSEERIEYSRQEIDSIRSRIDIPGGNQLNLFRSRVISVWGPRESAYEAMNEGIEALSEDNASEAVAKFNDAIKGYSREALFHAWKGKALEIEGDVKSARNSLDRALSIYSKVFRIQMFSGINHFKLNNYQQALNELERANELIPDIPDVIFYRGRSYEEMNNRDRAAHFYHEYLRRVDRGEKARYCLNRLRQWGYIQ